MREVIVDTETTGLEPAQGHRIVEIGALELFNHVPTGKAFHTYINPERNMPPEAEAIHGLGDAFLREQPTFASIADDFLAFVAGSVIVIHNAAFDLGFLNAELNGAGKIVLPPDRIVDTLVLARRRHPMGPNNLDALCRRYGVDNSRRTRHGALLDAELLAGVYLELVGGRQSALSLASGEPRTSTNTGGAVTASARIRALAPRLSTEERQAHARLVAELGDSAIWKKIR